MKKNILALVLAGIVMSSTLITNAQSIPPIAEESVTAAEITYNTEENVIGQTPYEINELFVSKDTVEIQYTGESEFIDVYGTDLNGTEHYVSEYAVWTSSNNDIIFADRGRLLAQGVGTAVVTASYGDYQKNITVTVKEAIDYDVLLANSISTFDMTSAQRTRYVSNANNMVNYQWTPSQTLTGWKGNYTFTAGTTYRGIPYSQTPNQTNLAAFKTALTASDFYSTYTSSEGVKMPRYGNDCSGFVSFAYELPRQNTTQFIYSLTHGSYKVIGSYDPNNVTTSDLLASYPEMTAGDALVKSGHAMFVANNVSSEEYCLMYEQTPGRAQTTRWSYSSLAAGGYMPFSK